MRIAFANFGYQDFHVGSVDAVPMGGTPSTACYLARTLAARGHEVIFITGLTTPGMYHGVHCTSWQTINDAIVRSWNLDALVCVALAGNVKRLREVASPATQMVLWCHHAHDQPGVQPLHEPAERDGYDGFAMVSEWQRQQYCQTFGLDPARACVLRNAIAPAFTGKFTDGAPILPRKGAPPVLIYSSTPFRGLDLLLDAFPSIRAAVPGTRLEVYASMQIYAMSAQEDEAAYGPLYQRCRETEGVDYKGPLPQPQLARAMENATLLAYPNTFPETSCITVLEAMASGCRVVTTDLGALKETTAGFARLIPLAGQSRESYLRQFVGQCVDVLCDCANEAGESEAIVRRQVSEMNANYTWPGRALEWEQWLESLRRRATPA